MSETLNNNINNIHNNLNNNINDLNNNMYNNINDLRPEINSNNETTRLELLERIDQRSRLSTRTSTRAGSRAVSPKSLVAQVNAKLKSDADTPDVPEIPRGITMANALPQRQARPSRVEQMDFAETPRANYFCPDLSRC